MGSKLTIALVLLASMGLTGTPSPVRTACSWLSMVGAKPRLQQGSSPTARDTLPVSKDEILSMLKNSSPRRVSQADIADAVLQRGINFTLDDKTIEEFRQAGARSFLLDAIKHAIQDADRPKLVVRDKDADNESSEEARRRSDAEELARMPLIEQARYHSLDFASELPNFIATQMVNRYEQDHRTGSWKLQDTLEIGLTYTSDKGENYRLLRINGQPTNQSYDDVSGSTSAGEFGAVLEGVFAPETHTDFRETKHDSLRGRDTVIYDFTVKRIYSRSSITDKVTKQSIIAGYTGSLWVDTQTKRVLRIEESDTEIPVGFPITLSEDAVDYDWVEIAGEQFLLPVHAEVLLGSDHDKIYMKNVIEFRDYRKFEGSVKVVPGQN